MAVNLILIKLSNVLVLYRLNYLKVYLSILVKEFIISKLFYVFFNERLYAQTYNK